MAFYKFNETAFTAPPERKGLVGYRIGRSRVNFPPGRRNIVKSRAGAFLARKFEDPRDGTTRLAKNNPVA